MSSLAFKSLLGFLWDAFCLSSIVGIWPRFIEPRLLKTTHLNLPIKNLAKEFCGFKILQFSDLHINKNTSAAYLNKISKKIFRLKPDMIVFTGDFLCYALMPEDPLKFEKFFSSLTAPHGCFAVLGNHDYAKGVSINDEGEYDVVSKPSSSLFKAFQRLGKITILKKTATAEALEVTLNPNLINFLAKTPFKLLHNACELICINDAALNICGLGEYMAGNTKPQTAFANYKKSSPGIILLHNPDGIRLLQDYPGDIILSGHTHGGQVNLPWMWKKFTLLENMDLKKGFKQVGNKRIYVNRGVGSVLPFRWFSLPELTLLTLEPLHE